MKLNKKAMSMVIVYMILGLVIVAFSIPIVNYIRKTSDTSMTKDWNIKPGDDFKPYDYSTQVKGDDAVALNSVNALIDAINSVSNNKDVNGIEPIGYTNIESYRITYVSELEILNKATGNLKPNWAFSNSYFVNSKTSKVSDSWINSDYNLNWCDNKNDYDTQCLFSDNLLNNGFLGLNCKCFGRTFGFDWKSSEFNNINNEYKSLAEKANIPLVKQLNKVSFVKLDVYYNDNTPHCTISVPLSNNQDLLTWKESQDVNLNGIKGSYELNDPDLGKQISNVLTSSQINSLSVDQKQAYFPNGIITKDSGENCLDSPTILDCKGIRVYYCGKRGGKPLGTPSTDAYYQIKNDGIHALAGAKFRTVLDNSITSTHVSMVPGTIMNLGGLEYTIYNFDAAQTQRASLSNIDIGKAGKLDCSNGLKIGNVTLKCTSNVCSLCNFELPQNITKTSSADYIAGYGDPKYVLYYESFPVGEEESWMIDESSVALGTIVMEDLFVGVLTVKAKIIGRLFMKTKAASKVAAVETTKTAESLVTGLSQDSTLSALKKAFEKNKYILNKKKVTASQLNHYFDKSFTDAEKIIKMNSPELNTLVKNVEKNPEILKQVEAFQADMIKKYGITVADRTTKGAVALWVASAAYESDLENQKFNPVGMNDLGLKIENIPPSISGQSQLKDLDIKSSSSLIVLVKDKTRVIGTSNYQRFYLASPCKADLKIRKTSCSCEKPKDMKGIVYYNYDTNEISSVPFESNYKQVMVSEQSIKPEMGNLYDITNAVKICDVYDKSLTSTKDEIIQTPCILIDPQINQDTFCYGANDPSTTIKYGVLGLNMATMIGFNVAFPGVGFLGQQGVSILIDSASAVLTNMIASVYKWPNHP